MKNSLIKQNAYGCLHIDCLEVCHHYKSLVDVMISK